MADKTVMAANIAAKVIAGYLEKVDSNSEYAMYTYVTEKPHNFYVGSQITITGLATSASGVTSASITGATDPVALPYLNGKITYTSTHFFPVGQRVTITGLAPAGFIGDFTIIEKTATSFTVYNTVATSPSDVTGTATAIVDLNVVNANICKIDSPTTFSVIAPYTVVYEAGKTVAGPATAQLINGPLATVKVQYAQPTT
jgi:hypothetical protein